MVRVRDLAESLEFYCKGLGLEEVRRLDIEAGRFSLVFLAVPGDSAAQVELTYNWDPEEYDGGRNFGHLAYQVDNIYATCQHLMDQRDHDQSPAPGRLYGLRALAGQYFDRATPEGWSTEARGALGVDGKYRRVVRRRKKVRPSPLLSCSHGSRSGTSADIYILETYVVSNSCLAVLTP